MLSRRALLTRLAVGLATSRFMGLASVKTTESRYVPDFGPFALGVASGDPRPDGFVLWTRLLGFEGTVPVRYEIARDEGFRTIVRRGFLDAHPARGHAVHVEPIGLEPGRTYFYRFHVGYETSRVGRTATIDPRAKQLRLALAGCQHWEHGWFSAYRDMITEEPDALLHVGDYIYEKSFGNGPDVRSFGMPDPVTLDEYRARHALYRTDPDLQDAAAAFPIIPTWDDHEVENDYAGSRSGTIDDPAAFVGRRAAAYQAWFEHMPVSPRRLLANGTAQIYRRFEWGALASLTVLDCRQFRTPQPCGPGGMAIANCTDVYNSRATMLGGAQEQWLRDQLAEERSHWSLIGQATLFSRLPLPQGGDSRWSDIWDGYSASRDRTVASLRQSAVQNPLILGGDVHSFWANDIAADQEKLTGPTVATEIVTSCLASRSGPEALFAGAQDRNPLLRYHNNIYSGYTLLDIKADAIHGRFRAITNLYDQKTSFFDLKHFKVLEGLRRIQI